MFSMRQREHDERDRYNERYGQSVVKGRVDARATLPTKAAAAIPIWKAARAFPKALPGSTAR